MNTFEYERVDHLGIHWYKWSLSYNGFVLKGESDTIKGAYRKGKRALRQHKKMEKRLNDGK